MLKYFCDFCGIEIDSPDYSIDIFEHKDRENTKENTSLLCKSCYKRILALKTHFPAGK